MAAKIFGLVILLVVALLCVRVVKEEDKREKEEYEAMMREYGEDE